MNESEEQFEKELAQAMRRVDAPEGFAGRVMERAAQPVPQRAKVLAMPRRVQMWATGAVAATVLAGVFATHEVRLRHQRLEAERAQRQFETAMRITDLALDHTRRQLQRAGVELGD